MSQHPENPADEAHAGTPQYGDFGHPADPAAPRTYRENAYDGSNDNPDEFSAFRSKHAAHTEHYCMTDAQADPAKQRGHAEQNQATAAIEAAQGKDEDVERAADDPRYAGGDVYDLKNEQTSL